MPPSSSRSRPDEPPLSETVTMPVSFQGSRLRPASRFKARSSAASPVPPPRATTFRGWSAWRPRGPITGRSSAGLVAFGEGEEGGLADGVEIRLHVPLEDRVRIQLHGLLQVLRGGFGVIRLGEGHGAEVVEVALRGMCLDGLLKLLERSIRIVPVQAGLDLGDDIGGDGL